MSRATIDPVIRVFEPALCCSTGVCGPDLDASLVTFTADLDHLQRQGVDIARHNLANDPGAFAHTPVVRDFLRVAGSAGLPLVLVDGVTVAAGRYPSREELLRYVAAPVAASVATEELQVAGGRPDLGLTPSPTSSSCCGGATECC